MNTKATNQFISKLFGEYESMFYSRFADRCNQLGKEPEKVLQYLKYNNLVETFENGNRVHVEFKRYLSK